MGWHARVHELKCLPAYFDAVASGEKPFEVRRDDRGFQRGDLIALREFVPFKPGPHTPIPPPEGGYYTGRRAQRQITYVLTGGQFGIEPGFVVLGLEPA